ncbi:MAG: hypothetical protein K2X82_16020 [Gemmataceae bacterium]|nr:hypothetical protein [Gemmataceae bacterium]
MPIRVPAIFRKLLTRPVARSTRPPSRQTRLSVTPLEDRTVPAGVPVGGGTLPVVTIARVSDATEGGAAGVIRLTRSGPTTAPRFVAIMPSGSASPGSDYPFMGGYTIPAGQASADIPVPATDDTTAEPAETATLAIRPTSEYTIGSPTSATLNFYDNDSGRPVVTVAKISDAAEGGANGVFRFTRTGSTAASLTVNYTVPTIGPQLATPGDDYKALSGQVTFLPGSPTADVQLTAYDDRGPDPGETVDVNFRSGAEYTAGALASASVLIADADPPANTAHVGFAGLATYKNWVDTLGLYPDGAAKSVKEQLKSELGLDADNAQQVNQFGGQSVIWRVQADPTLGGVRGDFVGFARYRGVNKPSPDAFILQTLTATLTTWDKDGKVLDSQVIYITEGFAVDANGLAKVVDYHKFGARAGITYPNDPKLGRIAGKTVAYSTVEVSGSVGWGLYDGKGMPAGENVKMYTTDPAVPTDPSRIRWLGPVRSFKSYIVLNADGTWKWSDEAVTTDKYAGKLNTGDKEPK